MRTWCLTALLFLVFMVSWAAIADENKGAEQFALDGGGRGAVPFPHHRHQAVLSDCDQCHSLYPKEKGSINKLKDRGDLAKKQVMNKQCIKCHKDRAASAKKGGPLTCAQCHVRE